MISFFTEFLIQINSHVSLSVFTVGAGAVVCLIFLLKRDFLNLKIFAGSLVLVSGLTLFLKDFTKVPRPENALLDLNDYAFPSGHSSIGFFLLTFFTYYILSRQISPRAKVLLIALVAIFAVLMATSRLLLNVHTIWQTICGAVIGVIVTGVVIVVVIKRTNHGE